MCVNYHICGIASFVLWKDNPYPYHVIKNIFVFHRGPMVFLKFSVIIPYVLTLILIGG